MVTLFSAGVARIATVLTLLCGLNTVDSAQGTTLWIQGGRPTSQALAAIDALRTADTRGLDPSRYGGAALAGEATRMTQDVNAGHAWPVDSLSAFDDALSASVRQFASDLHIGRVNPRQVKFDFVANGKHLDLTDALARAARARDVNAYFDSLEPPYRHYRALKAALQRYRAMTSDSLQQQHVHQIELTMERWRWLPNTLGDRFVVVNVPAFNLYAFDITNGSARPKLVMPVVVGKTAHHQTPIFSGRMQYLIFRPYWNVPPSILRHETLPKVRKDPRWLTRNHFEIVANDAPDAPTRTYPPTAENLALLAAGKLRVRQQPGPTNSLGRVKFLFPNEYSVYLHDTPAQELFSQKRRDFSHGCIRVGNPAGLAAFVLADQPRWTPAAIDSAMQSGPPSWRIPVTMPVSVYILYGTVLVQLNGPVHFYPDIYKLDAALDKALRQANSLR